VGFPNSSESQHSIALIIIRFGATRLPIFIGSKRAFFSVIGITSKRIGNGKRIGIINIIKGINFSLQYGIITEKTLA
jgi:hypothetical protein